MSQNKSFADKMAAGVTNLVENAQWDKATKHATFSADKIELPEGVSVESINTHIDLFNTLTAQTEVATAEIGRAQRADDDTLTTVDGTLQFGNLVINSQHHLSQKAGDDVMYGLSTTTVDYVHTAEQTDWLEKQRSANIELATSLFK